MAKLSTITLVAHGPEHDDGLIHQNDTVTFGITGSGVITLIGSRDGQTLATWALVRGDLDCVLSPSAAWSAHPGPLHVEALLREKVGNQVRTVAATSFEVAG